MNQNASDRIPRGSNRPGTELSDGRVKVDLKALESSVKDKKNIYTLFATEGKTFHVITITIAQIYLPPFIDCKMDFI